MFSLTLLFLPLLFSGLLPLGKSDLKGFSFVSTLLETGQDHIGNLIINFKEGMPGVNINAAHMLTFDPAFTANKP